MDRPVAPLNKGIPLQQFKEIFQELSDLPTRSLPEPEARKEVLPAVSSPPTSVEATATRSVSRDLQTVLPAETVRAKANSSLSNSKSTPSALAALGALGRSQNPALGQAVIAAAHARAEKEKQYRTDSKTAQGLSGGRIGGKIVRNRMEAPPPPSTLDFSRTLPPSISASPKIKPLSPGAISSGATVMEASEEEHDPYSFENEF